MYLLRFRPRKLALRARANRQELLGAGLHRREMLAMGLLTAGGGYLVAKRGLSAWASGGTASLGACQLGDSPILTPFVEPLRIMPVLPERSLAELSPAPTIAPN